MQEYTIHFAAISQAAERYYYGNDVCKIPLLSKCPICGTLPAPAASLVAILRRLSYKIFRKRQFSWVETSNENENLLFKFLSIKERICRTKFIEIMGKCMDFGSGHIVQLQQQTKLFMWKVCLKNQYCYNCSTSTAFNPHQKIYN